MVSEERRDYGKSDRGFVCGDAVDGGDGAVGMGTYQGGAHLGGCARGDDLDLNGGERGHGTRFAAESAARAAVVRLTLKRAGTRLSSFSGRFLFRAGFPCFPDCFSYQIRSVWP